MFVLNFTRNIVYIYYIPVHKCSFRNVPMYRDHEQCALNISNDWLACKVPVVSRVQCKVSVVSRVQCKVPVVSRVKCKVPVVSRVKCKVPVVSRVKCKVPVVSRVQLIPFESCRGHAKALLEDTPRCCLRTRQGAACCYQMFMVLMPRRCLLLSDVYGADAKALLVAIRCLWC